MEFPWLPAPLSEALWSFRHVLGLRVSILFRSKGQEKGSFFINTVGAVDAIKGVRECSIAFEVPMCGFC